MYNEGVARIKSNDFTKANQPNLTCNVVYNVQQLGKEYCCIIFFLLLKQCFIVQTHISRNYMLNILCVLHTYIKKTYSQLEQYTTKHYKFNDINFENVSYFIVCCFIYFFFCKIIYNIEIYFHFHSTIHSKYKIAF